MKRLFVFLAVASMLFSCTEKDDPYVLTDAAKASLAKFTGRYHLTEMRWIGPEVDVDDDGISDVVFDDQQVELSGFNGYAEAKSLVRLDETSYMNFGIQISHLADYNAGKHYSKDDPQLTMWLCEAQYSVDAEGTITIHCDDFDGQGQYLKNFNFELLNDGITITADGHLWDFLTNKEVQGTYSVTYEKDK